MKLSGLPSRVARSCIKRPIDISFNASGIPASGFARRLTGISSNRASMLFAPMALSISRMSVSVWGMKGISRLNYVTGDSGFGIRDSVLNSDESRVTIHGSRFFFQHCLIRLRIEQRIEFGFIAGFEFIDPTFAVGIFIDEFGSRGEIRVAGNHFAAGGAVNIRSCLDRLDHGTRVALLAALADFGHFDEHEIAERMLRVIGYTDRQSAIA